MVPLERLFVLDEAPTKPIIEPYSYEYEEYYNLGDSSDSKVIKLSKTGFSKEKDKYTWLFKKFEDVFAWKYEDLRTYDLDIFQRYIRLKEYINPFKHNHRQVHPLLHLLIE